MPLTLIKSVLAFLPLSPFLSQMWREEVGCLEMFLAYFKANVEDVGKTVTYRDFLSDILSVHEKHLK